MSKTQSYPMNEHPSLHQLDQHSTHTCKQTPRSVFRLIFD
jgi:hypothetical protein